MGDEAVSRSWAARIGWAVGSDRFFWGTIALFSGIDAIWRIHDTPHAWFISAWQGLLCAYATRKAIILKGTP